MNHLFSYRQTDVALVYRYRLTSQERRFLANYRLEISDQLCDERKWNQQALGIFINEMVKRYLVNKRKFSLEQVIQTGLIECLSVGSPLYYRMFRHSKVTPKHKLELLLKQMGAMIDHHGMLQLTGPHHFAIKLAPHGPFLHYVAKLVQQVYGQEGLTNRRLHQFRIYIDEHNIRYIRTYFKLPHMTDEQALQLYVKTSRKNGGLGGRKMIAERGRFHNKSKGNQPRVSLNRKRLCPNFHGEFILNQEGEFVSQWNVFHRDSQGLVISDWRYYAKTFQENFDYFEEQIINGESFNYASWNGQAHRNLDVFPTKRYDYPIRRRVAKNWRSPQLSEYKWKQIDLEKSKYHRKGL